MSWSLESIDEFLMHTFINNLIIFFLKKWRFYHAYSLKINSHLKHKVDNFSAIKYISGASFSWLYSMPSLIHLFFEYCLICKLFSHLHIKLSHFFVCFFNWLKRFHIFSKAFWGCLKFKFLIQNDTAKL